MQRHFITTAIDYPNAPPHMGHVLEKVLADVCARWLRLSGHSVRFQTGTDEHGIKIQRTAEKEHLTPQQLVDRNVPLFQSLYTRLWISFDDPFMRTSNQSLHWPTVTALWNKLMEAGALVKRPYTGLYCSGCEQFLLKRDLVEGMCAIHQRAPEEVTEENWFFLLKGKESYLKDILTNGTYSIIPPFRAPETLALIEQGLEDVSFSRPTSSFTWGIPVPNDVGQVMYVWCDALTNYLSGLGYFTDHAEKEWWDTAKVTHVIGKDIARFHAIIWPAMLSHAGVRPPDRLLIHGFLTSEGQKMSKSLGNVVKPEEVLARFGGDPDPLRFYLLHEIPVGNDGDFSWKRIEELYNAKLRNQLGNLLNRVLVLLRKTDPTLGDLSHHPLQAETEKSWQEYRHAMTSLDQVQRGIQCAFNLIAKGNEYIDSTKAWSLKGDDQKKALSGLAELLRHSALMLLPFMPKTALQISMQLNVPYAEKVTDKRFVITQELSQWGSQKTWKEVGSPAILFAPLEGS